MEICEHQKLFEYIFGKDGESASAMDHAGDLAYGLSWQHQR